MCETSDNEFFWQYNKKVTVFVLVLYSPSRLIKNKV